MKKDNLDNFRFCAIGDLHLSKKRLVDLLGENSYEIQLDNIKRIISDARSKGLTHFVFLGDICDKPYLPNTEYKKFVEKFTGFLCEYKDEGLVFDIILGNHDIEHLTKNSLNVFQSFSELGLLSHVNIYSEHTVKQINGITVEFMPYPCYEPKHKNSLCFAHIEIAGSKRDNGLLIQEGFHLPKDNLWVIGHLHKRQEYRRVFYPGTPYQTDFGGDLDKGYAIATVYPNYEIDYKFVPVEPSFKFFNLSIEKLDDLNKLDSNPLHKFKLIYKEDLSLPNNFLKDHENVVSITPYANKKEKDSLLGTVSGIDDAIESATSLEYTIGADILSVLTGKELTTEMVSNCNRWLEIAKDKCNLSYM